MQKVCFNRKPQKQNTKVNDYEESNRHFDINFIGCTCPGARSADEKNRQEANKLGRDIDALKAKVKKGGKATVAAITNL